MHALHTRVGDLLSSASNGSLDPARQPLILPVFVDGRTDAESRQSRIHRRHAIEMALNSFGYGMHYPDRMTYSPEIRKRTLYNGPAMSAIFLLGIVAYAIMAGDRAIPPARSARARTAADLTMFVASGALIGLAAVSAAQILRARGAIAAREDGFLAGFGKEFADPATHEELEVFGQGYASLCLAMEHGTSASRKLLTPAILAIVYAAARFPILDA